MRSDCRDEEIGLTVPVEAFEHYEHWLTGVVEAAGLPRFRLIDEPSAAALGYGVFLEPGDVYLIFDFGGGTLDVAVIVIEDQPKRMANAAAFWARPGQRSAALASISGCSRMPCAKQAAVIAKTKFVKPVGCCCRRASVPKERLSFQDEADIEVPLANGDLLKAAFSRAIWKRCSTSTRAFARSRRRCAGRSWPLTSAATRRTRSRKSSSWAAAA